MLHNKIGYKMKRILFIIAMFLGCGVSDSFAWVSRSRPDLSKYWGYTAGSFSRGGGDTGDFMIGGALNEWGSGAGTFDDEGGIIGVIAQKIVEHGGYFCPYQMQCANCRKCHQTWTRYLLPKGIPSFHAKRNKCAWLCEAGWSGKGCAEQTSYMTKLDNTNTNTAGGRFSGISIRTSGGGQFDVSAGVIEELDYKEFENGNSMVVVGVTKFLTHGVIAQPVYLQCTRYNWKHNDSAMTHLELAAGTAKLLCASGYKPNADNSDCEMFDPNMETLQQLTFCSNFPADKYDAEKHEIENDPTNNCAKYFCKDSSQAFAGRGDTNCVDCANNILGGVSLVDGTCKKCELGQYFDQETDACASANVYTKTDVRYGKGNTQSSKTFENHCWPIVQPSEFKECVENGGVQ